jgi:hypothetical protein
VIRLGSSSGGAKALILSGISLSEGVTLGKQWENFGIKWAYFLSLLYAAGGSATPVGIR